MCTSTQKLSCLQNTLLWFPTSHTLLFPSQRPTSPLWYSLFVQMRWSHASPWLVGSFGWRILPPLLSSLHVMNSCCCLLLGSTTSPQAPGLSSWRPELLCSHKSQSWHKGTVIPLLYGVSLDKSNQKELKFSKLLYLHQLVFYLLFSYLWQVPQIYCYWPCCGPWIYGKIRHCSLLFLFAFLCAWAGEQHTKNPKHFVSWKLYINNEYLKKY